MKNEPNSRTNDISLKLLSETVKKEFVYIFFIFFKTTTLIYFFKD